MTQVGLPFKPLCREPEEQLLTPALVNSFNVRLTSGDELSYESGYSDLIELSFCPARFPQLGLEHRLLGYNINTAKMSVDAQTVLVLDPSFHRELSCVLDSLFWENFDTTYPTLTLAERVRGRMLTPNLLSKTDVSSFGYVLKTGLDGSSNLFTLKVEKTPGPGGQLHEASIGKLVVNPLREILPNFVYTYSHHSCSAYLLDQGQFLTWCTTGGYSSYLYIEYIFGSTLFATLNTITLEEFVEVIYQLVNALHLAWTQNQFNHNDLHTRNVMLRDLNEVLIPYTIGQPGRYLKSRYLAQMIDFGLSTAEYQGISLSPFDSFVEAPSFRNDMHYFICNAAMTLLVSNKNLPLFEFMIKLYTIFDEGPLEVRLANKEKDPQEETFTTSRPSEDLSMTGFLEAVTRYSGYSPVVQGGQGMILPLNLLGDSCRFYERYYQEVDFRGDQYLDLLSLLEKRQNSDQIIAWLKAHYNSQKGGASALSNYKLIRDETLKYVNDLGPAPFENLTWEDIMLKIDYYYNITVKLVLLYDRIFILNWFFRNLLREDEKQMDSIEAEIGGFKDFHRRIMKQISDMRKNKPKTNSDAFKSLSKEQVDKFYQLYRLPLTLPAE